MARQTLPRLTDRLELGRTGLRVSPACLGMAGNPELVPAAFDAGINLFFVTGDLHWPHYEASRRGLELLFDRGGGVRDDVVVAVCSYCTQPEFPPGAMRETCEAVRGLGRIDVAVAGGCYGHELLHRYRVFERFRRERYQGIQAIGASFHDRQAAAATIAHGLVDVSYIRYNPIHSGARVDLFPYLDRETATLVYNFKSTSGFIADADWTRLGLPDLGWRPRITDYYRFALSHPKIDGLLCSPRTAEQVRALSEALGEGPLSEDEERRMLKLGAAARRASQRPHAPSDQT